MIGPHDAQPTNNWRRLRIPRQLPRDQNVQITSATDPSLGHTTSKKKDRETERKQADTREEWKIKLKTTRSQIPQCSNTSIVNCRNAQVFNGWQRFFFWIECVSRETYILKCPAPHEVHFRKIENLSMHCIVWTIVELPPRRVARPQRDLSCSTTAASTSDTFTCFRGWQKLLHGTYNFLLHRRRASDLLMFRSCIMQRRHGVSRMAWWCLYVKRVYDNRTNREHIGIKIGYFINNYLLQPPKVWSDTIEPRTV